MELFVEITVIDSNITTIEQVVDEYQILIDDDFSISDLINYQDNKQSISNSYLTNPNRSPDSGEIEAPVTLKVPSHKIRRSIVSASGNILTKNTTFNAFLSDEINSIVSNPNNTPLNDLLAAKPGGNSVFKVFNRATVWIYSRVLDRVINLTPFIKSVNITNSQNGGNFNFDLLPLTCYWDDSNENWVLSDMGTFLWNDRKHHIQKSPIINKKGRDASVNNRFFTNVLSSNDLVFIQFEVLQAEQKRKNRKSNNNFVSFEDLPDNQWDMIGLVDSIPETMRFQNSAVSISVAGRDLMKVLIEDGSYFFPLDFASNEAGFIANGGKTGSFRRLVTGELSFFNAYVDRSIQYSLSFIFNQLANAGLVPDKVFKYFKDKTFKYDIIEQENTNVQTVSYSGPEYRKTEANGVWKIIKLIVDDEITTRRIVDSSISTESGSLINFVRKVCQDPFVEFYSETFGDKFYFIARKPPFTQQAIKSYITNNLVIEINADSIYDYSPTWDDSQVYSWYRLIPKGNFFGDSQGVSLIDFPAVYFNEYAEIWGSRPYQVVSNYIDYQGFNSAEKSVNLRYLRQQSLQDLSFIIETNAYLPFTRKGKIVIKGDRRIKKGMWVRLKPTSELVYVESVSNTISFSGEGDNVSVERYTIINFNRGMKERNIFDPQFNYFNIIDLRKINGVSQDNNFSVNKEVFEYFLKRKQMRWNA